MRIADRKGNRLQPILNSAVGAGAFAITFIACATPEATAEVAGVSGGEERWNARFQATYVYQSKRPFEAPYSGPRSLRPEHERSYTFTSTAYLGFRPWRGGELYVNPEAVQGRALSEVSGLGGLTNGEIQKVARPRLSVYRARLFVRQTWGLGGGRETLEADANQLAGAVDRDRLVLTAGNVAVIDLFGLNEYAGDPRTQFLNWSFLTFGAFDYAADLRGYTWGTALEYYRGEWTLRAGRFLQPKQSNGMQLDTRIGRHFGEQVELEHRHALFGRPGKVQVLAFRNVARMASFSDALALGEAAGTVPDIEGVRRRQSKRGWGIGLEQALGAHAGAFARFSAHDGKTETYAFTEIDRSISAGAAVKGARWGRSADTLGLAFARNEISRSHRNYLAAGGTTFFLGDGGLHYRPEAVLEAFYSVGLGAGTRLTADWQRIRNSGYNADRGPVNIASLRLHWMF